MTTPLRRGLSQRGHTLAAQPPTPPYIATHFDRAGDIWHPETNPGGYAGLGIAENKLVADLVAAKLDECRNVPPSALGYDAMIGSARFRTTLADFMGRHVLHRAVSPHHIAVLGGAGSVLELLFYVLGDPGDTVLVPTPSYAGFWADLETRDQLVITPVHGASESGFRLTTEMLDDAISRSDRSVCALLFTSPNNPLGTVYSEPEVAAVVDWAVSRKIHVVFDEIYALSVFGRKPFFSSAEVQPTLGEFVHIVWAFSKDFGASGLRCGVLISENEAVIRAVDALAYWAATSTHTQWALGQMVSDDVWVRRFLGELRTRLGNAYGRVGAALGRASIPYVEAEAGIFVLCDLRGWLDEPTWDAEDHLWHRLVDEANVVLTPGAACRVAEPGFFRLCYAAAPTECVVAGIERIGTALAG